MTNEMTAEEAIKWLKDIERSFPEAYFGEWRKALRMAIQALEAQPTDAVSRSELMKLYKEWQPRLATNVCEFEQALEDLPSVTPERPKGKWIFKAFDEETGISDSYWCSECNRPLASAYNNYCPNCGSYNAENKENEND